MKIGLAQIKSKKGDLSANIAHHLRVLEHVDEVDVNLVMFPELSLSNYDPDVVAGVAVDPEDRRLDVLQEFADTTGTAVGVGVPTRSAAKPLISALVFVPQRGRHTISKRYLHPDEREFFSPAPGPVGVLSLENRVAIAICHEVFVPAHIEAVIEEDFDIYLASVAKTAAGISEARRHLSAVARQYSVPMLMVNSVGSCEGKVAGGGSAVITDSGEVIAQLSDREECLLIHDCASGTEARIPIES